MLAQFEHLCLITATCHKRLKPRLNSSNYWHWTNQEDKRAVTLWFSDMSGWSSCLSHELVSGGIAFSLPYHSRGLGGHSYDFNVYYSVGCISTLEFSTVDELARSSWVRGIFFFYRCNLLQVLTSDIVLKSLLCRPMLPSTALCAYVHASWRQILLKIHPRAAEAKSAHFLYYVG